MGTRKRVEQVKDLVHELERANWDMRKLRTVRRSRLDVYTKVEQKLRSCVTNLQVLDEDPIFTEEGEDIEDILESYARLEEMENLLVLRLAGTLDSLEGEALHPEEGEEREAQKYGTGRKVRWYWVILLLILLSVGAGQCF